MFSWRRTTPANSNNDNSQNFANSTTIPSPDSFYESNEYQQQQVTPERYQRTSPARYPSLPPVPEASEESSTIADRDSISSDHTVVQAQERWVSHTSLPTIRSGESLNWANTNVSDSQDPFSDAHNGPRLVQNAYPSSASQAVAYVPYGYSNAQDNTYEETYASEGHLEPMDTGYSYTTSEWDHNNAGSIDHFNHDTEAYASGLSSRPSYRPPRSRSPTPAVDDEDYHVVGNNSVHYTGYSPSPNRQTQNHGYDEVPLETQIGQDVGAEHMYEDDDGPYEDDFDDDYDDEDDEGYGYDGSEKAPEIIVPPVAIPQQPPTPVNTRHFGPAPVGRVLRRHKTKKRVQLTNGNLVVDLDVPPKLILPRKGVPEMMKTRYTAVTCDPDDFEKDGFFLRQNEMSRTTELMIVITMYNEDEILFCRTLYGVMRNIAHLCTRKNSRTWGQDAWKKVVVCIVADGRKKVHPRVLDCLTLLGVYQPGQHMINKLDHKPVTAHLFEYTTSFGLDPNLHFRYPDKGIVPTQIIFCMKEKNQKKINSHRWFFNAFAHMLQPNVCVLLDVGTRPGNKSIYHLWKAFDMHSNVAGACGEIAVYKGPKWSFLLNPLVAAQNFEYKIANTLDKPTESLFGYISVLPGAFSAYRYIALQNDKYGRGPLASYFKGEVLHGRDTDIFTSNMYLAEDRILCFELVAKSNSDWVLRYVKSAIAETDVPDALPEFINQRRRWLNGSFFAATYSVAHFGQILRSGHSIGRKSILVVETVYNVMNLVASWFGIGNFFIFFMILSSSLESEPFNMPEIKYINPVLEFIMAGLLAACFLFSMGNKPKASPWKYMTAVIMYAAFMVYIIYCAVKCSIQAAHEGGGAYRVMLFSIIITYGVYAFSSLLAFDPWHMFTSFIPYMLLSPSYINILNIYAFANLDDISWGTKQDTEVETDLGTVHRSSNSQVDLEVSTDAADVDEIYNEALMNIKYKKPVVKANNGLSVAEKEQAAKDYYANVRTNVLLAWVLSNGLLIAAILGGGGSSTTFTSGSDFSRTKAYMTFILVFVAITSIVRFLGSTMYLVARIFTG